MSYTRQVHFSVQQQRCPALTLVYLETMLCQRNLTSFVIGTASSSFTQETSLRFQPVPLAQLCPTRGPEGFMRPSLGFRCSKSILHTDNLSLLRSK